MPLMRRAPYRSSCRDMDSVGGKVIHFPPTLFITPGACFFCVGVSVIIECFQFGRGCLCCICWSRGLAPEKRCNPVSKKGRVSRGYRYCVKSVIAIVLKRLNIDGIIHFGMRLFPYVQKKDFICNEIILTPIYINNYKIEGLLSKITLIKRKTVE